MTTVYYNMKCIGVIVALLCCSAGASAQYLKKETVKDITGKVAVIYGDGLPESAVWPMGTNLMNPGKTATIRHQTTQGNGSNKNMNSKVSRRFIVHPTDGDEYDPTRAVMTWAWATYNYNDGNNNLNEDFATASPITGCASLITGGRKWRLPTQRELQLMLLFRKAIDVVYPSASSASTNGGKMVGTYWSSTENSATQAWTVTFIENGLECSPKAKTSTYKLRCVSDY